MAVELLDNRAFIEGGIGHHMCASPGAGRPATFKYQWCAVSMLSSCYNLPDRERTYWKQRYLQNIFRWLLLPNQGFVKGPGDRILFELRMEHTYDARYKREVRSKCNVGLCSRVFHR